MHKLSSTTKKQVYLGIALSDMCYLIPAIDTYSIYSLCLSTHMHIWMWYWYFLCKLNKTYFCFISFCFEFMFFTLFFTCLQAYQSWLLAEKTKHIQCYMSSLKLPLEMLRHWNNMFGKNTKVCKNIIFDMWCHQK